jgi:nucleoside-triphosphatase
VAASAEPPRLLLEGRPGSGKTTAVARLVALLRRERLAVTGFLTRELRERGERVGFTLETLDGRRGILAHVSVRGGPRVERYGVTHHDLGPRVERYGVTHHDLERLAIPALRAHADVVVVDELGKMELTSAALRDAVIALLDRPIALVATVHARPDPFTDQLKRRPCVAVLRLTRSNRDDLPADIARRLRTGGTRA